MKLPGISAREVLYTATGLETGTFQDSASKLFKRLPNDIKLARKSFKLFQTEAESKLDDFFAFLFVWLSYYFQLYIPTCTLIFIRITHVIKWDRFNECRLLRKKVIKRPLLLWKTLLEKYRPEHKTIAGLPDYRQLYYLQK